RAHARFQFRDARRRFVGTERRFHLAIPGEGHCNPLGDAAGRLHVPLDELRSLLRNEDQRSAKAPIETDWDPEYRVVTKLGERSIPKLIARRRIVEDLV